jgi:hypothetical protein
LHGQRPQEHGKDSFCDRQPQSAQVRDRSDDIKMVSQP